MVALVTGIHILISLLILLIVLSQGGEHVDITAAFGGVSQAAFGPRGTVSTLAKATWVLGGLFMITSIMLSVWAGTGGTGSVLHNNTRQTAPVSRPAPPAHK